MYETAKAAQNIWQRSGFLIDRGALEGTYRELVGNMEGRLIAILSTMQQNTEELPGGKA